jgi:hypothetical protein
MKAAQVFALMATYCLLYSSLAIRQGITALPKQTTVRSPGDVRLQLLNGPATERAALAAELGLVIPRWKRWRATKDIGCDVFDSAQVTYAALQPTSSDALLQIYSRNCEYAYVVVFEREPEGYWTHIDTVSLWSKDSEPEISLESLVEEGTKEVVVRHCATDYGTGVSQTSMMIFKLFRTGMHLIFNQPERVTYAVPAGPKLSQSIEQSQQSDFEFIAPSADEPRSSEKQILEKQVVQDRNATITRRWLYIWVPEIKSFQAVLSLGSA